MEFNETNPEETQETSPLEVEQTPTEVSEDEKTPEEGLIPYSRFKEVIEEKNTFKTELELMKNEIESLKAQEPEEEPATWQEAEKRTIEKAAAKIREDFQSEAEKERQQEMEIERGFENLKKIGQDVNQDIRKAVLSNMIKTGKTDVIENYLDIKSELDKNAKTTQVKKEGFIPPSQKGSEATPTFNYNSIRGKSPVDIAREAGLI